MTSSLRQDNIKEIEVMRCFPSQICQPCTLSKVKTITPHAVGRVLLFSRPYSSQTSPLQSLCIQPSHEEHCTSASSGPLCGCICLIPMSPRPFVLAMGSLPYSPACSSGMCPDTTHSVKPLLTALENVRWHFLMATAVSGRYFNDNNYQMV